MDEGSSLTIDEGGMEGMVRGLSSQGNSSLSSSTKSDCRVKKKEANKDEIKYKRRPNDEQSTNRREDGTNSSLEEARRTSGTFGVEILGTL